MDLGFCPKGGDLNPEHTCWLMGFPPIWLNCTPLETPSSCKSPRNSSAVRAKPLGPSEMTAMPDHTLHPLADILPMMDEAALAELAADIKAQSEREPIYLWQDQIIDGGNRFEACKIAGVEPVFKRIEFPGGEKEALAFVVSRNLKRRHLNWRPPLAWSACSNSRTSIQRWARKNLAPRVERPEST